MLANARPIRRTLATIALLSGGAALAWAPAPALRGVRPATPVAGDSGDAGLAGLPVRLDAAARGTSGSLHARIVDAGALVSLPLAWDASRPDGVHYRWRPVLGTEASGNEGALGPADAAVAPSQPGVYELELGDGEARRAFASDFRLIVRIPFREKRRGYLGSYFMGTWPTEGERRSDRYAPPAGFIRVTPENEGLRLSEHFTLANFLTHDQGATWPKYVVLDERLLDKLELVMQQLDRDGAPARHMVVMSGFRTPQYNRKGLSSGRAVLSRHQYGDAADVWVDNDSDWYMDDLNGDGRRDTGDARVVLRAVERVEARHPDLVGGAGIYHDNGVHGPFIHIDVRGKRARW